jgi:lysine-N-methylase
MKSKLRTLPIVEQWDCHHCTACCRETTIQLNADDLRRLDEQRWEQHPEFRGVRTVRRSFLLGGAKVLVHKADGSCVFLTDAGLCRIHEVFGADAKPFMCQQFPLQVVTTDRESLVTAVRSCPSAAADRGRAVGEHLGFLKRLICHGGAKDAVVAAPPIAGRTRRGWDDFYVVAEAIQRLLVDERLPLVRRLVHCVRFCGLLEQCKWKRVGTNAVAELIEVLEENAQRDIGEVFRDRAPPSERAGRLFRRLGAHFIRCFPGGRPTRTLGDQWQVMRMSERLAGGARMLPELHPHFSSIKSERLDEALGPLSAEVLRPLGRFFESHAVSKRYAIGPPGGSLVDSVHRLAFAFPMALWILRWLAAEREPMAEDMVQIVVGLERGISLPGLNRAARFLAESGQLERLIAWYGR